MNMLNSLSIGYQDSLDFNNLPIPFACMATDISTGKEVILNHGSLPLSIRATMAIPGVFAPVNINGRVLCDGGMVNNFPVDVAKAMGADIIIGVDVQDELAGAEQLKSLPQIFSQIILLMGNERYMANRKLVDVYIKPDVRGFSTMSFSHDAIKTLIASGYAAADKKKPELEALATKLSGYKKDNAVRLFTKAHELKTKSYLLSAIEVDGIPENDGRWLLKKTELGINRVVSGQSISNAISIFMGTGAFKCVKYQLIKDNGKNSFKLVINFEKGPANEFAFNFRYDSEEAAALLLHLGIHTYDLKGSRLGITGRLSYNPYGRIDYSYVFKNFPQLNVSYMFKSNDMNIYKRDSSNFVSFDMNRLEVSFSNAYLRNFDFTAGLRLEYYDFRNVISKQEYLYDSSSKFFLNYFISAKMDTRDDSSFPSEGMKVDLHHDFFHTNFHGDFHKFMRFRVIMAPVVSLSNRFTLLPSIMGSFIVGKDNRYTSFYNFAGGSQPGRYVDGQLPFVGINYAYAFASSLAIARLDMRERIGKKHYIYGITNYLRSVGNIADMFGENCTDSWGVGIRYAYDSKFGPISVDCHWSDYTHKVGLYVNLGYYF
jgi:NTE family protein